MRTNVSIHLHVVHSWVLTTYTFVPTFVRYRLHMYDFHQIPAYIYVQTNRIVHDFIIQFFGAVISNMFEIHHRVYIGTEFVVKIFHHRLVAICQSVANP